ncbi:MAG: MmoB/DmpM family protein [Gammaproteobacteria bacterium]
MSTQSLHVTQRVNAKLMVGEEASAIAAAACLDNPGATVEDHGSYLTISGEVRLDLNIRTIAEELGRPYDVPTLLVVLTSYTGQVDVGDDRVSIKEALAN